jgi:transcriptional regulator with XRE-family HTH domain
MTTSGQMEFLSEILEWEPVPQDTLVYFRERLRHRLHAAILAAFTRRAKERGLKQSDLAKRIHRKRAQITRWLSTQSNLTLDSISDLMVGLGMDFDSFPFTPIENTVVAKEEKREDRNTEFSNIFSLPETKMELTSDLLAQLNTTLKSWIEGTGSGSTASIPTSPSAGATLDATQIFQKQVSTKKVVSIEEYRKELTPKAAGENCNALLQVGAR